MMGQTHEEIGKKKKGRDALELKMRELSDQRQHFAGQITHLDDRIANTRAALQQRNNYTGNGYANNVENQAQKENEDPRNNKKKNKNADNQSNFDDDGKSVKSRKSLRSVKSKKSMSSSPLKSNFKK